ncbi:MAG: hypothetical protein ACYDC6_07420 [Acidobacteriaceae bacterium]
MFYTSEATVMGPEGVACLLSAVLSAAAELVNSAAPAGCGRL